MSHMLRPALVLFLLMTLLTGVVYPLAVTAIAQAVFPHQANGSLIERGGRTLGSELIGQSFHDPKYFWGRPSATLPTPYNAAASAGSNLGPTNPVWTEMIQSRIAALRQADPGNLEPIPVDLVTASGSGLDPHISPAAALFQVQRVARTRGIDESKVLDLVRAYTEERWFGIWGEPRVNVLMLNLALDGIK
jgi:potassium-transporting ATPase KdpC subunit